MSPLLHEHEVTSVVRGPLPMCAVWYLRVTSLENSGFVKKTRQVLQPCTPTVVMCPSSGQARDAYRHRLPFTPLLENPWSVLEPQLRADTVSQLVPLAGSLFTSYPGRRADPELYVR